MALMPTDFGFRLQVVITVLVGVAVIWVGVQTGDWTGLVLWCRSRPSSRSWPSCRLSPRDGAVRKPDEPQAPGSASARDDEPRATDRRSAARRP